MPEIGALRLLADQVEKIHNKDAALLDDSHATTECHAFFSKCQCLVGGYSPTGCSALAKMRSQRHDDQHIYLCRMNKTYRRSSGAQAH